jgi:serine/threonine-protein kinase
MKTCPTCRSAYPSDLTFCPHDGAPLAQEGEWREGVVVREKYRILARIGEGGMGAVYKALHLRFDELRALKVLRAELTSDREFLRRFEQEALLTRKLQHPHVVRVDDIDKAEDGQAFIVMEFIQGRSLVKVIEEEGALSPTRTCAIVKQAASALEAAHGLGLIHRDIKPHNIVLIETPRGEQAKVLDFGIAKLKEARLATTAGKNLTREGAIIGTPQYMSPEQAMGKRGDELDGRSDLYSLGVTMYQMLTGHLPFKADTTGEMLLAHIEWPPKPIYEVRPDLQIPRPLADLVMACLEKKPEKRPPNAAALITAIERDEAMVASLSPQTTRALPHLTTPLPSAAKKEVHKKPRMITALATALIVILLIGGLILRWPPRRGAGGPTPEETQLERVAKGMQDKGDLQGALGKWQELAAKKGPLKTEADSAIAVLTQTIEQAQRAQRVKLEASLFDQAKAAQDQRSWNQAIELYSKVAEMKGPLKDRATHAIVNVYLLKGGMEPSKVEQQTFQKATDALKKEAYAQARGLFQQVIDLKVPHTTLAPKAQSQITQIDQILMARQQFDAATQAETSGDLNGALAQFQNIANGGGPFASQAKARIPKLKDLIDNAVAQQAFNAAIQAENNGLLDDALTKFNAIASKPGPLRNEAQKHVRNINAKLEARADQQSFDAAVRLQDSGDLDDALALFNALASKPGAKRAEALQRFNQISQQIGDASKAKLDQAKFDDGVKRQSSGDLPGALAEFKALAGKPGAKQAEAMDRVFQVSQAIAEAKPPLKLQEQETPGSTATTTPVMPRAAGRNPVVTPLVASGGDLSPLNLPYRKGMLVPDFNVDGGVQATNLSVPPVQGAAAGSIVLLRIMIDENGNVTATQIVQDTSGFGLEVQKATRGWKFKPLTTKGKPVNTSITVKVTF